MSSNNNNSYNTSGGIGVFDLLGVTFVVLKLTGYIDWSWWLVTLPFWGGIAFIGLIFLIIFMFAAIYSKKRRKNLRR